MALTPHLADLESEAIFIFREAIAYAERPVILYSIGKDSSVLLHVARKAFYPSPIPCPLLHIDTTWKFREMIAFRDDLPRSLGVTLKVHTNREGIEQGVNPFDCGSELYTKVMKTNALKQALEEHRFDVAFGGARRDEEPTRAKERICSIRSSAHCWEPKFQRPEVWSLYNCRVGRGESMRVFPLSNWTELDVWVYILAESIPVVPLYFSAERLCVLRDGQWIVVDDDRMRLVRSEVPVMRRVRFRTLGCYPLTAAIESDAADVGAIVHEMRTLRTSERCGRLIDRDQVGAMEIKKRDGYF